MAGARRSMVAYWMPKEGTDNSDWEDGAAYSLSSGWFAVSDGASTGTKSREWAYSLTQSFIAEQAADVFNGSSTGFDQWVGRAREQFDPTSNEYPASKAPQWVQSAGAVLGSHATFLGGRFSGQAVEAVAVGDCCLFHVRTDGAPTSFPLNDARQFGTSPALISSLTGRSTSTGNAAAHYRAPVRGGDVVFVVSDAFAEWLMRSAGDPAVWGLLTRIGHHGFRNLCADLRARRLMKNDDVTLFRAITPTINGGGM